MAFGITFNKNPYINVSNSGSIDNSTIREVAQEIFGRAETKSVALNNIDLSKFNRPNVGLDLYNGNVNPDVAKNISLQSAGQNVSLNREVLANIQYLNTQAAKAIHETPTKNMNGKIHVNANDTVSNGERAYAPLPNTTTFFNTANTAKDKQGGGNPFYGNSGNNSSPESASSSLDMSI